MPWQDYGDHKPKSMNKAAFNYLSPKGEPLVLTIADFKVVNHAVFGEDKKERRLALLFHEPDAHPYTLTNERCVLLSKLTGSQEPEDWVGKTIGLELVKKRDDKEYPELQRKLYPAKNTNELTKAQKVWAVEQYQKDGCHYQLNRYFLVSKETLRSIEAYAQKLLEKEFEPKKQPQEPKTEATPASQVTDKEQPDAKKVLDLSNEKDKEKTELWIAEQIRTGISAAKCMEVLEKFYQLSPEAKDYFTRCTAANAVANASHRLSKPIK